LRCDEWVFLSSRFTCVFGIGRSGLDESGPVLSPASTCFPLKRQKAARDPG